MARENAVSLPELAWLLLPAIVAFAGAEALRRSRWGERLGDRPNERSLHTRTTPRVGGVALLAGAVPVAALHATTPVAILLAAATLLAIVSLLDDARSLPVQARLAAHFAAAIVAVLACGQPLAGAPWAAWAVAAVAVLAIAWMTNLFNFMDGADGLAGGMAAIGFATLAAAALGAGALPLAWCAAALASASLGFLAVNFPPARVFMGDAGSIPLGFLAGALGFAGAMESAWPWWFPVLVFSPFIVDASVTLLRRLVRGERVWHAHREHAYQRLVLAGWSKRRLAWHAYALMLAVALTATASLGRGPGGRYAIISLWAAAFLVLLAAIERRCRKAPVPDQETPASGLGP